MQTEYFLASLDSRLHRIASRYASADIPADDMYQEMVLGLLEKAQQDPEFPNQTKSYILQKASFIALSKLRGQRYYNRYGKGQNTASNRLPQSVPVDAIPSASKSPEKAVESLEQAFAVLDAIKGLSETDRAIVQMVYQGHTVTEITQKIGVSPAAISMRRKVIANTARRVM